jgi:tripartite-type tricarboxylate transporter receptor subunit TctC
MRKIFQLVVLALMLAAGAPAFAQAYPSKPVRFIVAFAPGGPVDVVARLVGQKLQDILGQSVVVENRPSSSGNIGAQHVARSQPDGYTVLVTSSAFVVNVSLFKDPGYEVKEFVPIVQAATQPNVVVVNSTFPAKTLPELLEMAKTQKLAYASPGTGTTPHLTGEHIFKAIAHLDVVHVPHKGAGPAVTAVVSGQPPIGSLAVTAPIPFIKEGRLHALAISSAKRHPLLPDVPTFAELGYPEIEEYTWVGFFAPAGTPPDIVQKLNDGINKALQVPEVRDRLVALTFEPIGGTPQQFADYVRDEVVHWSKVVKETGAKVD